MDETALEPDGDTSQVLLDAAAGYDDEGPDQG